jgi:hypothetical protein
MPTPPPSGLASYAGCTIFTSGDFYNAVVTSAAVDPNSAAMIAGTAQIDPNGFYLSTGIEKVNLANAGTARHTVNALESYHQNEWNANPAWPWTNGFYIESLSDAHALVLDTSACRLYESSGSTWSGSTFSAETGWSWDLTRPFVMLNNVLGVSAPSSMASGLSMFAGAVKAEELQAGVINHALNFAPTKDSIAQWTFVAPASDTGALPYNGSMPNQVLYGSHLRLHASYSCPAGPQAKAICVALKTYGMYVADTGSGQNALYGIEAQSGSSNWNAGDLAALGNMHITDFDVLKLPIVQHVTGH